MRSTDHADPAPRWRPAHLGMVVLAGLALIAACERSEPADDTRPVVTQAQPAGENETPESGSATPTSTPTSTTAIEPVVLDIWADDLRANVLEPVAAEFTDATGVDVAIRRIEFADLLGEVESHGIGEGPDVFFGAGDWAGRLAEAGIALPIDLGNRAGEFIPVGLAAFSYQGILYGVPHAAETIAVYYNTNLVEAVPATIEEVADACAALEGLDNCFGVPGGGGDPDVMHHYPFLTAEGGGVFAYDPATGYDPSVVLIDSRDTVEGVELLEDLVAAGIIAATSYDRSRDLFLAGTQPFWMTGPWEIGPLEDTDVSWSVGPIPSIGNEPGRPIVGASGWYINAASDIPVIAQSFVMDYIATSETMLALFEADRRPPAHVPTLEVIADPVQAVFAAQAADGLPWPTVPEMQSVWQPLGEALERVRTGEASADAALRDAQVAIVTELGG